MNNMVLNGYFLAFTESVATLLIAQPGVSSAVVVGGEPWMTAPVGMRLGVGSCSCRGCSPMSVNWPQHRATTTHLPLLWIPLCLPITPVKLHPYKDAGS